MFAAGAKLRRVGPAVTAGVSSRRCATRARRGPRGDIQVGMRMRGMGGGSPPPVPHVKEDAIHAGPSSEGRWVHGGPRRAAALPAACSRWVSVGLGWFLGFLLVSLLLLFSLCLIPA